MERTWRVALLAVGLLVALLLPHLIYPVLAIDILLWGLFAVAFDLLLGFGGLLSFGHAAFWGSGAYAAGLLAKQWALPVPLAALGGMVVAALLALPVGYLSIRRTGIYFAMVTLAFAQMVFYLVNQWGSVTGGENGLQSIPKLFFGLDLSRPITFYYVALPMVLVALLVAYRVVHSPFGRVLVAIRDNEARAKALGYPTARYKLLAFLISAALSGFSGGLFAVSHGFTALEVVHWTTSGTVVMMTILGGIGTFWGSLVGSALVLLLRDWLSARTDAWGVVTGAIFVLVVLSFRRGIWGTLLHWISTRRGGAEDGVPAPLEASPQPPDPEKHTV